MSQFESIKASLGIISTTNEVKAQGEPRFNESIAWNLNDSNALGQFMNSYWA